MIIQHVSEDAALRHPRHEVRSTIALSSILTNQQKVTDDSGQEKYLSSSLESVRDLFYANDGINQQKAGRVPLIFVTSFFQYSHHFRGGAVTSCIRNSDCDGATATCEIRHL